jgi:PEP-CTERM motif
MLDKIVCAAVMASACVVAHAEAQTWTFSYTGFYDEEAAAFLPTLQLAGEFTGADLNHNGAIDRAELSSLTVGDIDFIGCAASSNAYFQCGTGSFSYLPGRALNFTVGLSATDPEGLVGGGHFIETGNVDYSYRFTPYATTERHLHWTAQTALAILSPVPEPGAYAMLGIGLLGLTVRQARRRRC